MSMLDRVQEPADLRGLSGGELESLADEIRRFLVQQVAATGGHLGPNLGVVETTLALHRVFDSPHDPIIFDTGHQAYVHKILTGRRDGFATLRKKGGLSGYPSRAESEHDWVESSHASASLSYADGMAKAFAVSGQADRTVVAVVGDGALTGGMCWEALNNIAEGADRPLVVVVNDNGRSYSPTIGGLAAHLSGLRLQPGYERALENGRRLVRGVPVVGEAAYKVLHGVKTGVKDAVSPQVLFTDLGLKYLGPVDGHDIESMESALRMAKEFGGPVIVHAVTRKGMGYAPAENDEADQMHSVRVIDPATGLAKSASEPDWTSAFSAHLVDAGAARADIVAITAAMGGPTGLSAFGRAYPDRFFDVGIAEQHAVASASGMALAGMHPVVAIYSTFLNRAFDQLLMDVALLGQPVTLVLDRAGVTGSDGASHNGMWDLSLLGIVPGIRVAAPRDAARLREELDEALAVEDGPTVVRFPKGALPAELPALERIGGVDVLARTGDGAGGPAAGGADVLIVGVGPFAAMGVDAAQRLRMQGISATVVDPRWVIPTPDALVSLARTHSLVVTLEDGGVHGGVGSGVSAALRAAGVDVPCREIGVPQRFLDHGSRGEVLADLGLTPEAVAREVTEWVAHLAAPTASSLHTDTGRGHIAAG
ncbi:1-deoxy-D-xylulose-5-phosphate synthase [Tomitella fengzijianii]|uniref:1-deoxy-D-xylulose-5-phosphate synthase n=1 Tax=Tomitella fengzijianii TaxID=2597660 RepID=A0A516X3G5_9ACTN|nr:1-deoxy-D-xylulose-5-phosphate synthase [Tomitella fengzijianii]QDQ97594.1 1-deoxy-D-xylulose-5-phosphate synthase [Tomitella fengzijianii]